MADKPRGQALLAWAVILGLVGFVLYRNAQRPPGGGRDQLEMKIQGRYLVGWKALGMDGELLLEQARPLFEKNALQRLDYAVLAGELAGGEEMLAELEKFEAETEEEAWAAELLERLAKDEEIPEEHAVWLVKTLGWFGRLALARQDEALHAALLAEARRTVVVLLAVVVLGLFGLVIGMVVLALAGFAALRGWVAVPSFEGRHGGVYAETFALYLTLFLGLSYALSRWKAPGWEFGISGLAAVGSLLALFWPALRGVSWAHMRDDLGLRVRWLDVPLGVGTYLGALPVLLIGVMVMLVAMGVLKRLNVPVEPPSHPVAETGSGSPWWVWVQLVFLACVCAPVVEELFFRGVFQAHLNRLGKTWPTVGRVALAVGVSSFVFAVIHPQGWLGVPVLGALASAFALAREWRGSVVPGMVAHAINNGVAMTVLYFAVA